MGGDHNLMVAEQLHHVLVRLGARPSDKGYATDHDRVYLIADAEAWLMAQPFVRFNSSAFTHLSNIGGEL